MVLGQSVDLGMTVGLLCTLVVLILQQLFKLYREKRNATKAAIGSPTTCDFTCQTEFFKQLQEVTNAHAAILDAQKEQYSTIYNLVDRMHTVVEFIVAHNGTAVQTSELAKIEAELEKIKLHLLMEES